MINNVKNNLNQSLAARLVNNRSGKPWYGKNFDTILKAPELNEDSSKILAHIIVWMNFVQDQLKGINTKIDLNSPEDWPDVSGQNQNLILEFESAYDQLVKTVLNFKTENWDIKFEDSKYSYRELVEGILEHNLYHMGQIAWISKSR